WPSMARMRKAGRRWRADDARAAAERVMFEGDGAVFTVVPRELFAHHAPLELELGAGRGDFIIERAAATPAHNFLAVELAASVARLLALRAGARGLTNLRVLQADARALINLILPEACLSACHIYFPDPWPKARQAKRRLFTPRFVAGLTRVLAMHAPLYVATDVGAYAAEIFTMLEAGGFEREAGTVPGADQTGFARKFMLEGRPIFAARLVKRSVN
ncbi:MAG: tRNA (guanine(46)-N(7))-methyltransferase TrmB, partial [Candidatus Binataceae bacterium]